MKVRIGVGASGLAVGGIESFTRDLVEFGFDSLWVPDVLGRPGPDPLIAMTWAAAVDRRIKIGTTLVLPGQNPVRLAKQLATLDVLTNGRLLVTFVAGNGRSPEREVIGVEIRQRLGAMEKLITLIRQAHEGGAISYDGPIGRVDAVTVEPRPMQRPFEFWLGGNSRASLKLCGRVGDGWLPGACLPSEAAEGREVVEEAAAEAGRIISPEHFGVSFNYSLQSLSPTEIEQFRARSRRPDAVDLVPVGVDKIRERLDAFVAVGFSKFVLRPVRYAEDPRSDLESLAKAVGDLQT